VSHRRDFTDTDIANWHFRDTFEAWLQEQLKKAGTPEARTPKGGQE
jgi:hypothetical protein